MTHELVEGQRLLLLRDNRALDEEFVLAFGIGGKIFLHRLEEYYSSSASLGSGGFLSRSDIP